jgi:multiple sugar transport system permease protein
VKRARRNSVLVHVAAVVTSVVILAPFLWMVMASITPQRILITTPLQWIPDELDLSRYTQIFTGGSEGVGATFRAAMMNSIIVAVGTRFQ